jgi:outer membrane receptor protein involved in Fe transport
MHTRTQSSPRRQPVLLLAVMAAVIPMTLAAGEVAQTLDPIDVVGTTPLAGVGVPRQSLPANVLTLKERKLVEQDAVGLAEALGRHLPSVYLNEVQGNPYQADLNYRGFTASPLLGTAQGLSVYLDGVRVNEAFGDTVNWDLLPTSAIAGVELFPGSNPIFGLNTLGGALAIHTKSGFSHPGGKLELSSGSYARGRAEVEYGGNDGSSAWYVAGNAFREDGWREFSPSQVGQLYAKLSRQSARAQFDLSLNHADSVLVGNGLAPESMLASARERVFSHPDETRNRLTQVALKGDLWLSDLSSLSGIVYYRRTRSNTLNGDISDDYEDDYESWLDAGSPPEDAPHNGVNNRTHTLQRSNGGALQWNLRGDRHRWVLGASFDQARMNFRQTEQEGTLDNSRGVTGDLDDIETANELRGTTRTASLYLTDTVALTDNLHLTASARYNRSHVLTVDEHNRGSGNLDGDHRYQRLNPALGLTWQATPALNAYAGLSQGNRIPSPIELGCADRHNPCSLPNAMAADPYLKQVVARTFEAGLRGKSDGNLRWNAGIFRTINRDDILFVGTGGSLGYFTNFGKTERKGLEFGLAGRSHSVEWHLNYSWLRAVFGNEACLLAENNSTRGTHSACTADGQDDEILVQRGDRLPGLPEHSMKLGLTWQLSDSWRLSTDLQAYSRQYARGNENNRHQNGSSTDTFGNERGFAGNGRLPGYAVLNLNVEAKLSPTWSLFAKIANVFDRRYASAAALAENPFQGAGGGFDRDPESWRREPFVAPGAPRAAWLGIRYVFAPSGAR